MKNAPSYPILYSFRRCPYAIRARMALSKSNITIELREISLKKRPDALYKISPKGTVPVLQLVEDTIIDESLNIMLWAINNSNCDWLKNEREKQLEIISINDGEFKYWLDRYKYSDRFPELNRSEYQNACSKFLNTYDIMLKDETYFYGKSYQLVDIALFPFIRQCANIDQDWFENNFLNLSNWLNRIKTSTLFLSVMNKYDLWNGMSKGEIIKFGG